MTNLKRCKDLIETKNCEYWCTELELEVPPIGCHMCYNNKLPCYKSRMNAKIPFVDIFGLSEEELDKIDKSEWDEENLEWYGYWKDIIERYEKSIDCSKFMTGDNLLVIRTTHYLAYADGRTSFRKEVEEILRAPIEDELK